MRRLLHGRSITVRVTVGFLCATAVLYTLTGAFVYERMNFALNRSIADVPSGNRFELDARRRHRDEALHELLGQLAIAFSGTLLVGGLVGYRVARAALDPVERMRRRAGSASADHSFRLPVPDTSDELSRLAETLNHLLARVDAGVQRERRLVADASHELRTPLSQLLLQADLALSRERTPEELRAALTHVRRDVRRLVRLADDLLLIARADEGRLPLRRDVVRVVDVAEEARDRFAETARAAGREIVVEIDPGVRAFADRDRLGQLVDALLDNALIHGDGDVRISAGTAGAAVTLRISDEGAGFPDEFRERAFERFATATTSRTGTATGLGLAIVAAIAEAHGGSASASNRPGGGAEVCVELPASLDRASAAAASPRAVNRRTTA
jgi:two-component system OmpR family sensor kinase